MLYLAFNDSGHTRRPTRVLLTAIIATVFLLAAPSSLEAQGFRATINGDVTDPSGGGIPNATVKATNVAENTAFRTTSGSDGRFVIPAVKPGIYEVTAEASGFRRYVQTGLVVHVNAVLTLAIHLEVGEVQQSVTVSGESPLLTPESASLGQIITNRVITEMPINGRNVMTLMTLSAGVLPTAYAVGYSAVRPYDTGTPTYITTSGAPEKSNLFLLNGMWDKGGLNTSYTPSVDSVQEFKMQRNPYDAEYGHASGAVANIVTKSGTNSFHGSLFEFHRNSALDANSFFSNKVGRPKTPFHYNQFGGTFGGPVLLPGYNGKNRTFFFFNYEGLRLITGADNARTTVPSDAQRRGDFSATRTAGRAPVTIYDPSTVASDPSRPGQFIRQPFAGNQIPQNRFNTVAQKILDYYPRPNMTPDLETGLFNFTYPAGYPTTYNNYSLRVDHNFSEKDRFYAMWGRAPYRADIRTPTPPNLGGGVDAESTNHANIDYVRTISPQLVMNVNLGFQRKNLQRPPYSLGFDVSSLGFPKSFTSQLPYQVFPVVSTTDMLGLGSGGPGYNISEGWNSNFALTKIRGRHTMKMGMFWLTLREYDGRGSGDGAAGVYSFDSTWTQANPLVGATGSGYGLASFLLGVPTSGRVLRGGYWANQSSYYELFFQDDFKVTSKLTLNLGMRWEYQGRLTERFDRTIRDFDFTTTQPIQAAARVNYAKSPIAQLAVDQLNVRGGVIFAGVNAPRAYRDPQLRNWGPRLGIAYRANNRMVLRTGFGAFYYGRATGVNQTGFNSTSEMVVSVDGINPLRNLADPFPDGLQLRGASESKRIDSLLGWAVSYPDPRSTIQRTLNWSAGFQYQLPHETVLDLSYVGSDTGRFNPSWDYNQYDVRYLSLGSELNRAVPNPFLGLIPASSGRLGLPTVALNQLLRPFPHYQSVGGGIMGAGRTYYHSMQMSVERRMAAGFAITGAYTISKLMFRNTFMNPGWSNEYESVIGNIDYPQRLVVNSIWEMPFGRGKRVGGGMNPVLDKVIGGWQLSGIYSAQSGAAISAPGNANATGQPAKLSSGQSIDNWFNKAAFAVRPAFTVRTLSSRISQVRQQGLNSWDIAIMKHFPIREGMKIQFRSELFNAFNHVLFGAPDLNLTGANFTKVLSQQNQPRQVQFGLKILF